MKRQWILPFAVLFAAAIFSRSVVPQSPADNPEILRVRYVTVVVPGYDEALRWYTGVLGLEKVREGTFGEGFRWIVLAPRGQKDFGIILELARPLSDKDQIRNYPERVGKETRWVFEVNDCRKFYDLLSKRGVKFLETPVDQLWGETEAQFVDLYGNVFVIASPSRKPNKAN